jgi:hypothetical protein
MAAACGRRDSSPDFTSCHKNGDPSEYQHHHRLRPFQGEKVPVISWCLSFSRHRYHSYGAAVPPAARARLSRSAAAWAAASDGLSGSTKRTCALQPSAACPPCFRPCSAHPLTAALFALEVISVGVFYYSGLVPCIVSALTAYGVTRLMGIAPTRFILVMLPLSANIAVARGIAGRYLRRIVSAVFCSRDARIRISAAAAN